MVVFVFFWTSYVPVTVFFGGNMVRQQQDKISQKVFDSTGSSIEPGHFWHIDG